MVKLYHICFCLKSKKVKCLKKIELDVDFFNKRCYQVDKKEVYMTKKIENTPTVDLSWRRFVLPAIHPEGVKIVVVVCVILLCLGIFLNLWSLGLLLLGFTVYFFRNPPRVCPKGKNLILAPADGLISKIEQVVPPKSLGLSATPLTRVSIFMSIFSVHVNRAPVTGTVIKLHYHPGKFVSVAKKESDLNERQEILMQTDKGQKIAFTQIAGLVARRIYCPLRVAEKLEAGEIFGMIRFGSRLDVYLPQGVKPEVEVGQSMVAGETIIAHL